MPRKYVRRNPARVPTDPVTLALLPAINAAVDARIAEIMRQWLAAHGAEGAPEGDDNTSPKAEPTPAAKPNGGKKSGTTES